MQKQVDFLAQRECVCWLPSSLGDVEGAAYFRLYAVSEKDARLMVRVFIETLTKKVEDKLMYNRGILEREFKRLSENESELAASEEEIKTVLPKWTEVKRTNYFLSEAEAEQIALEMNKKVYFLEVEIVM